MNTSPLIFQVALIMYDQLPLEQCRSGYQLISSSNPPQTWGATRTGFFRMWRCSIRSVRQGLSAAVALFFAVVVPLSQASTWAPIRTTSGPSGWQSVVCDNANNGWQSCEMGLKVELVANPASIAATGEVTTITATVTDYFGASVGSGTNLAWSTTSGTLGASQTATDVNGQTNVTLRSSNVIGGATVTAATVTNEGQGSLFVPFTDAWEAIAPTYTAWADYDGPYNCSGWTPSPSTVPSGSPFTQSQNCYQNQITYRQDRQQSQVTGQIVNAGSPVPGYQAVIVTQQQTMIGTLAPVTPPPTPPSPPPAEAVCVWVGQKNNNDMYSRKGWTYLTNNNTWALYDVGPTGAGASASKNWRGPVDYNGYRYTVGAKVGQMTSGRNFEFDLYQMCKAPL
ncbi:Ig-like domain-containing protein (plasmid) [Pseudomonas amygdali pv. lachrymans]|uniref:Ig-like domain-containing protein n=1 Tax=Pseudomonas amygdali TaxID=47877 RepID=UPI0006CD2AA5|nr:Ig-like domain-containing protein [Pseudomonas amygdali]KPC02088.1 Uncharacterized protein AC501_3374 [Pseudomonas amygdali pv. lachrymans]WIO61307.1 Ig-like domain-containing protein [Pseudomonas amygdali pv. lachrymans]